MLARAHVAQRTDDVAGARSQRIIANLCKAEVGDPNLAFVVEYQVRRLDVAMNDSNFVCVVNSAGGIAADGCNGFEQPLTVVQMATVRLGCGVFVFDELLASLSMA